MALKLDDFLTKKKEPAQVLDLSKATANTKEEFRRLLEKVPEYKIRPEKVKPEEIKIKEKDFTFKTPKRELRPSREYPFADPVPPEMRGVKLEDLSCVNIQWKMLTTLRPKNKQDEELFTRLVELGKLRLQTEERERKVNDSDYVRKMKNRAGVLETRLVSCAECGEEFCSGELCGDFMYDASLRENKTLAGPGTGEAKAGVQERGRSKSRRPRRSKSRRKSAKPKSKSRERRKSKSYERPKSKSLERKKSLDRRKSVSLERARKQSTSGKKSLQRRKSKTAKK
ncbi:arginine/serine-rich coiled-coil protein 2 [Macrosteles quadrilineatus]|uniref:arginine/serine-rich coiled-coil protein 2 n=1 Tax=Macrosteles quadrilineatus TaxID=74068 RepID=UPI0023E1B8F1|nr:arginine/serine-rich coiled-coil protein 2 [Macrosteles quadrilineatus]